MNCAVCRAEITQQNSYFVTLGHGFQHCCEACYAHIQKIRHLVALRDSNEGTSK